MARRKKKEDEGGGAAWLVTFSDLMTLLLTFFVLLLSMASMDTTILTRISVLNASLSPLDAAGSGRVPEQVELLTKLLKDPLSVLEKQDRIKDLLFPVDILPPEISKSDLDKNLSILQHPEGVVIVLTDGLLFPPGSAILDPKGQKLIDALTPVMHSVNVDINISGHTDNTTRPGMDNDTLSYRRAESVLERFLHSQLPADRFSVSGYGADRPMFSNSDEDGRSKNRRVEILVKTTPRIGSYL